MNSRVNPPKLFLRFFRWFCHPKLKDHIEGDLMELYAERVRKFSKGKADRKFILDVMLLFRPGIIRPAKINGNLNNYGMFKSYFKVGWRNLIRNKGYSAINIGGLAFGMTIVILIGLWMHDEFTFDRTHDHYDRLAYVMQHQTTDGKIGTQYAIPRPLENALRDDYPNDFTYISMSSWTGDHILSSGEQKVSKAGNYVQADFPEMFSLKMMEGSRAGLKDPSSILLSVSAARALFGTSEAMNQAVRIDNKLDVKVTGIFEDLPNNSSMKRIEFLASWELYTTSEEWVGRAAHVWDNNSFQMFAQIAPGSDMSWVSEKIKNTRINHTEKAERSKPQIFLHPMSDWELRSAWENGVKTGGKIELVYLFGTIGAFVLLLACINFMNLSTARSEKRAKEVGIRMTIGSVRSQLINQFLSESFLVVLLAFVIAVGLASMFLPWFNDLASKKILMPWSQPYYWLISLAFVTITSLLAGSYPALYLSSFRPVAVLRGTFKMGRLALVPRKVLVVVQFTVSVILVIGTIVVYQQIQFSKNRPLGYDKDGLVLIQMKSPDFYGKYDILRSELKNVGAIEEMSESSSPIGSVWQNSAGFTWQGKDWNLQAADFGNMTVTHEYGKTLNWKIKEGRDFSREFSSDSSAIILNESAVKFIGVKDPMGMEITYGPKKYHVIGIVNDIIMESPYKAVRHNIYRLDANYANWINLKLNRAKSASECLALAEAVFKKHIPSAPFDYKFADQEYAKKFNTEERIGKLSYVFAGLAILISCLGLFGLASFVAEQRTKEIGIRKVLGASISNLWRMLSTDFFVLVILSCIVATPLAYYAMHSWLQKYQYHIEISWWIFAIASLGAIAITLLTVSFQAIKAAIANPVKSLRSE